MSSSVSLEAMFVWRLFDSCLGNFVEQQSCEIKWLDFGACLTWAWVLVFDFCNYHVIESPAYLCVDYNKPFSSDDILLVERQSTRIVQFVKPA